MNYCNVHKEFEKNFGIHASSRKPTKKCATKMKVELEGKNEARVKMLLIEGGSLPCGK